MISQQEVDRLYAIPGEVRGVVFKTDAEFIRTKQGEEGLKQVEQRLKEWGHPVSYDAVKNTEWLPVGMRALSVLAAKEAFQWDDKTVFEMGHSAPQYSFMVKFLMRHFLQLKDTYEKSSQYWPIHYTVGYLESPEFNGEKGYLVLRLKDFDVHPALCPYYAGFFLRIAEFASDLPDMKIDERSCSSKDGADSHEFVVSWTP